MPYKPRKICNYAGCNELTYDRYCEKHAKQNNYDKYRGSAASRGYDYKWQKARKIFLQHNPLCVECYKEGRLAAANVVDHIVPHKGNKELFWNKNNWQSLCKSCHDRKTITQDMGSWEQGG